MLRHPAPEALTFMIYQKKHTATMTCGSKCYILLLGTMLCFDDCRAWIVLVQIYAIFRGGVNPSYPPLMHNFELKTCKQITFANMYISVYFSMYSNLKLKKN